MRITGGPARGRKLSRIDEGAVRPPLVRLRQSIFSILDDAVADSRILDLYAGSGAFGLEALSRGARDAVFVESDRATARRLEESIRELGFRSRARVIVASAFGAATFERSPGEEAFDLVFVDPPFDSVADAAGVEWLRDRIRELVERTVVVPGGTVVVRTPRKVELDFEGLAVETRSKKYGKSLVTFVTATEPRQEDR